MDPNSDPAQESCRLEHSIFSVLGAVTFRRAAADGMPVMIIPMGHTEASVPLRSLQREFDIEDNSPDGRMLGLIAESLDFVAGLQMGDRLPTEVLTGDASWDPRPRHRMIAATRLRLKLMEWLQPDSAGAKPDAATMARMDDDQAMRTLVTVAFARAAEALEVADGAVVVTMLEDLAGELSYIEALRENLLRRVQILSARMARLLRSRRRIDTHKMEPMNQVARLTETALRQISGRFAEVDGQTGEVISALRNAASQRSFIRSHRDFLYRSQRAWDPILTDWEHAGGSMDDWTWHLIGRTYQFLAPRYMMVSEWQAFNSLRQAHSSRKLDRKMTW